MKRLLVTAIEDARSIPLVSEQPLYDHKGQEVKNWKSIVGPNGSIISINSRGYKLIQHREVAESALEMIHDEWPNASTRILTTGDNRRLYVDIKTGEKIEVPIGSRLDETELGLQIVNSYDKSKSLSIHGMAFRSVCDNVLYASGISGMLKNALKEYKQMKSFIRHYGRADMDIQHELDIKMKQAVVEGRNIKDFFSRLGETPVNDEMYERFVSAMKLSRKHQKAFKAQYDMENRQTLWELYNAGTFVLTHEIKNPERREVDGIRINRIASELMNEIEVTA